MRRGACCGLALALGLSAARAFAEPSQPELATERARETYREGVDAFNRRDFEAARIAFLQTLALKPDVLQVRRNLGLAEIYSGHYAEGARRLAQVLAEPAGGGEDDRERMAASLRRAEAHLERLTIEVDEPGATIEINGERVGAAPLSYSWYVDPGPLEIRVSKPGHETHFDRRTAVAGVATELAIHLPVEMSPPAPAALAAPAAGAEPAAPAPPPAAPLSDRLQAGPSLPVLVTGSAVVVAAAVAAGVLYNHQGTLKARFNRISRRVASAAERQGLDSNACPGTGQPWADDCERMNEAYSSQRQSVDAMYVSLVVASVAAAGTLAYGLWPRGAGAPAVALSVSPMLGSTPGLRLSGSF